MGWTPTKQAAFAGARSHIKLNLRRQLWVTRRALILSAFYQDLLPLAVAQQMLQAQLIPNPWRQGGMVYRHNPFAAAAAAYQTAQPHRFTDWFMLPDYSKFVLLADLLDLPAVVTGRTGCIAGAAGALLIFIFRLHNGGSWGKIMQHAMLSVAGANWSPSKRKSTFRAVTQIMHRLHGARASWSKCCMDRAQLYGDAMHAVMSPELATHFAGLGVVVVLFMDGTRRAISRAMAASDGTDLQMIGWNNWWHGHNHLFVTLAACDGLIVACSGPHHGHNNDQGATNAANVLPALGAHLPPNAKAAVDEGFAGTNGPGPLVGKIPGGPFSADRSDPRDRCNAAMCSLRNSVELPYGCVVQQFPCLELGHNRARTSTTRAMNYRNAIVLSNVLLCLGQGHGVVGSMFDCPPPSVADYLA